jgi:hypothetical protein
MDGEADDEHALLGDREQLAHDYAGVARSAGSVRPARHDLEAAPRLLTLSQDSGKQQRRMARLEAGPQELCQLLGRLTVHGANGALDLKCRCLGGQMPPVQHPRQVLKGRDAETPECRDWRVHPKNAASGVAMVGTASARSSQSLRCSQLGSAISRHP